MLNSLLRFVEFISINLNNITQPRTIEFSDCGVQIHITYNDAQWFKIPKKSCKNSKTSSNLNETTYKRIFDIPDYEFNVKILKFKNSLFWGVFEVRSLITNFNLKMKNKKLYKNRKKRGKSKYYMDL